MGRFYHLDRGNLLVEGKTISLAKFNDISSASPEYTEKLQNHYNVLFPNGVTQHGNGYFANEGKFEFTSPFIELLFEYVRRANFSDKPSRAESFFALDSPTKIKALASMLHVEIHNCTVWEVECETYYTANMRLLSLRCSNLVTSYNANEYWSCGTGGDPQPFWEYLLVPPVKILSRINI